eukprot:9983339-Ditylum_brightwellii.AAC.1
MLQEVNCRLKTEFGVSKDYYSHCKIFPIYVSGQGAMNSSDNATSIILAFLSYPTGKSDET